MSQTDDDIEDITIDEDKKSKNKTDKGTESIEQTEDFDEEGEQAEEAEVEEEPEFYDPNDFISGPRISRHGTLPLDILKFDFSYGYNCRKNFNLVVLDANTVTFASGNLLNFLEIETKKLWFRRSALGGGIGHIRKNPNPEYPHFAVAESGRRPIIIIYEWPSLNIVCILRGGAKRLYSNMDYSPDGELLVSQSGEPDYLITVWNWQEHKILLRNKSYVNDVYRVKFSPYLPGQITTCGVAHIKFWKMASTFTGLKLKGEVGRFGKTEYSDILGVLPMPDSKVVSGCDWGNILIWDGGLITLEIFRSLRRKCHDAPIVQFYYADGELWTVSLDGHVRIWWYEKIDHADPPDDDRVILIDPSYDFYTPGLQIYSVEPRFADKPDESWYIAQDGNGGIWQIDLNTEIEPRPSTQLYKCHAGKVVAIAACPFGPYLASLGNGGRIYLYNYLSKKMVFHQEFPARGTCMLWLKNEEICRTGDIILAGFDDGQIRVCCINIKKSEDVSLTIIQIIKPHNKPITTISINDTGTRLVSGSEDCTIFFFELDAHQSAENVLTPIGFIPAPDVVTCFTWHPTLVNNVLLGCLHGQMMQVSLPFHPERSAESSLLLILQPQYKNFASYKSQIRRNIKLAKIEARKAKKLAKKRKDMEVIQKENPGLEIDEDIFLADSDSEEELEPLYYPDVPNKILWLKYTESDTIWLSMGGYDAGYIYEYKIDQNEDIPYKFKMVYDGDDIEISSYVYDHNKEYIIFAMQDGSIRVNKIDKTDFTNLSDYWTLAMHDNQHGFVPNMCFSSDGNFFFSCGHDGNIFSFEFHPPPGYLYPEFLKPEKRFKSPISADDSKTYVKLSLEETMANAESDRIQKAANEHKVNILRILRSLKERHKKLLDKNRKLLPSQFIPEEELELDERVTKHVDNELQSQRDLVKRKIAYNLAKSEKQMTKLYGYIIQPVDLHPIVVQGINDPNIELMTVRQRKMGAMFPEMLKLVGDKLIEEESKGRHPERVQQTLKALPPKVLKTAVLEYFLLSLSPSVIESRLGPKLTRILIKYRERREKWDRRYEQWDIFLAKKPIPGKNHPDDEKLLAEARERIGDYKLKEDLHYKPPPEMRETTVKKYKQVLDARLKQNDLRHIFIQKVWDIRDQKYVVRNRLIELRNKVLVLNEELPHTLQEVGPDIPAINLAEFPEERLKPKVILPVEEDVEVVEQRQQVQEFVEKPDIMQLERELLPSRSQFPKIRDNRFVSPVSANEIEHVMKSDLDNLLGFSEETDTPMEMDVRVKRLNRQFQHQKFTIATMQKEIKDFNNTIIEAKKERLPIHVGGNFIDIYILTLNQELNILKKFEDGEDQLSQKVVENLKLVHKLQDELDMWKNKKEENEVIIENFHTDENRIQDKFKHAAENNKYFDFLKKVFRKKFKPPKQATDDDLSSESSSSSSEESDFDDSASIDSRDFGFIKQDLNVCPKGCEVAIFNLTVDLRSKRHEIEQSIREQNRIMDTVKKDIEMGNRRLNVLQNQLKTSENELDSYQREKQNLMNKVYCTVVLSLDQIHDYNPEVNEISKYIVFSKSILSDLYKRVGTLQNENSQQSTKYESYHKHLTRMKKDLRYMKGKIKKLKLHMQTIMSERFGKIVDLDEITMHIIQRTFHQTHVNEMEEIVLKKRVYDIRMKSTDVKDIYIAELGHWNTKISNALGELAVVIKENTKRLDLLYVMNKEKKELVKIIMMQPKRIEQIEKILEMHSHYLKDIEKLNKIIEDQCSQLQELKTEIKMLKTKGMSLKSEGKPHVDSTMRKKEKTDEEGTKEWHDYDKYIEREDDIIPEKRIQEVNIPGLFYASESEDIVSELVKDIFNASCRDVPKESFDMSYFVRTIINGIVGCPTVDTIINGIIGNLPFEPTQEQRSIINASAEKLYQVQELEVSDASFPRCAKELLEDTVDEALLKKGEVHEVIANLVEKLVESVPVDYILREDSIESIVQKISYTLGQEQLDKTSLIKSIERIPSEYKEEMLSILNVILARVFGSGIDYLYVIKNE